MGLNTSDVSKLTYVTFDSAPKITMFSFAHHASGCQMFASAATNALTSALSDPCPSPRRGPHALNLGSSGVQSPHPE
eukprot:8757152-Heterocapsa_arctica.AAC.1